MKVERWTSTRLAFLTVVVVVAVGLFVNRNYVLVNTPACGNIRGVKVELEEGKEVYEFHNIPYAVPPVGDLRFKPTQELESSGNCYQGTLDATNTDIIECIQAVSGNGTEDCLVLTVRSPDLAGTRPVVFWVHGGGLMMGNSATPGYTFSADLTAALDVVVVNVNYRLGYLGFGAFEELWDPEVGNYGNNGFRDMVAALKWVQNNIAGFGGDPGSVTIIGESGGGTAVLSLVSSPLANGLFHNAISLSPAPEFRFDYKKGNEFQRDVLRPLGCDQETAADRRQCLMDLPAALFSVRGLNGTGLAKPIMGYFDFPMRYGEPYEYQGLVTVDPAVVTVAPKHLQYADFTPPSKVKVVVSNTAHETAIMSEVLARLIPGLNATVFNTSAAVNATFSALFGALTDREMLEEVYALYPGLSPQRLWDTVVSDLRTTCPTNDLTEAMSASPHHDVYRLYISNSMQNPPHFSSFHAWDTYALFGFIDIFGYSYTPGERDVRFSERLQDVIRKLAGGAEVFVGWEPYPANTLVLGNQAESGWELVQEKPQSRQCGRLSELDLVKYGSQN